MTQTTPTKSYLDATGAVTIPMHNDYLFRALLQKSNNTLKALIAALLHLEIDSMESVEIQNPIELGEHIEAKDFILDIKVLLNNRTIINLEMQVVNEHDWTERSLCYLCRAFDNLSKGEAYGDVRPAVQIGLLDFTLFPDAPEFYATYLMKNVKSGRIYSSKFRLSVLDLTQIEIATEEDKRYRIDYWAALFKAETWEELKQMAQDNTYMQEAVQTVYQLSEDERIRQRCEAREEFYRIQNGERRHKEQITRERDEAVRKLKETSTKLDETSHKLDETSQERDTALQVIAEKDSALAEKDSALAEKDSVIAELRQKLAELENNGTYGNIPQKR